MPRESAGRTSAGIRGPESNAPPAIGTRPAKAVTLAAAGSDDGDGDARSCACQWYPGPAPAARHAERIGQLVRRHRLLQPRQYASDRPPAAAQHLARRETGRDRDRHRLGAWLSQSWDARRTVPSSLWRDTGCNPAQLPPATQPLTTAASFRFGMQLAALERGAAGGDMPSRQASASSPQRRPEPLVHAARAS